MPNGRIAEPSIGEKDEIRIWDMAMSVLESFGKNKIVRYCTVLKRYIFGDEVQSGEEKRKVRQIKSLRKVQCLLDAF